MSTGLYVHVPFCLTRCGYCDFNAYSGMGHLAEAYTRTLRAEAELWAGEWADQEVSSMFFGGGTPTTLPAEEVVNLVDYFRGAFHVSMGAEITTEANPDTVDERYLAKLLRGGIGRLSMGVQSFDPEVLVALERVHSPESSRRAYAASRRAGFNNVNLDLIFGADGETLESWQRTVEEAVTLGPEHLSCYALTVEPATPLGRKVAAGLVPPPDPDLQAEMYDLACGVLASAGYLHYEISNWCRPGYECRHNLIYWRRRPYLGLGAGAHSFHGNERWWNLRPPAAYMAAIELRERAVAGREEVGDDQVRLEEVFLRLRTSEGVPADEVPAGRAEPYLEEGLLARRGRAFALTERGMFLANEVALALSE